MIENKSDMNLLTRGENNLNLYLTIGHCRTLKGQSSGKFRVSVGVAQILVQVPSGHWLVVVVIVTVGVLDITEVML